MFGVDHISSEMSREASGLDCASPGGNAQAGNTDDRAATQSEVANP